MTACHLTAPVSVEGLESRGRGGEGARAPCLRALSPSRRVMGPPGGPRALARISPVTVGVNTCRALDTVLNALSIRELGPPSPSS